MVSSSQTVRVDESTEIEVASRSGLATEIETEFPSSALLVSSPSSTWSVVSTMIPQYQVPVLMLLGRVTESEPVR